MLQRNQALFDVANLLGWRRSDLSDWQWRLPLPLYLPGFVATAAGAGRRAAAAAAAAAAAPSRALSDVGKRGMWGA